MPRNGRIELGLDVLIVDDEKNIRITLRACLEALGCRVSEAATVDSAVAAVDRVHVDLVFLDLRLGEADGLDLLPRLLAARPNLSIVIITAYSTVQTAVNAMQRGARDYLPKPFTPAEVKQVVEREITRRALEREVADLQSRLDAAGPAIDVRSEAPAMQALLEMIAKAAQFDVPVLLTGEHGTGKTALARHLHLASPRRERPFIVVSCPTLSEELLASELFGHARGAFTGATRDQPGRVEAAEGGTLFLDEIADIAPALQAKLLRFVQDKEFERVGETRTRSANVRIVAASNRDLAAEVKTGRFREDLLFRLNTFELLVPPLRERRADLLPLARRFAAFFARSAKRPVPELSSEAEAAICAYDWPGNVRELRNAMERAVILVAGNQIGPELLPGRVTARPAGPYVGGKYTLEAIEREHILSVLRSAGTPEEAARILGIDPSTLWRKRKRYEEG